MYTQDQVAQMIEDMKKLQEENALLKAKKAGKLSLKVSDKGAVSMYGLGRFPVTLYREQWVKVFAMQAELEKFMLDNAASLSAGKPAKNAAVTTPSTDSKIAA